MDDITNRTSAWLAFTLAFDSSAKHCDHLQRAGYTCECIGKLIANYRDGTDSALGKAVGLELSTSQLGRLRSAAVQEKISAALDWAQTNPRHYLIGLDHPRYPEQLRDTTNPPPLLYAKGDLTAFDCPAVAVVGSRKASRQAIDYTHNLAARLAERGVAIVSGLARGIDAAAHEGALAVGGRTIAVAATEPGSVYPKRHAELEHRIISNGGLILTEYPLGAPTLRWYFPRRNRIISGLSVGVLVAEAGLPSGTLTTAAHAADQGREVMAIPGSVLNPQTKGCHALIKQGAALVEDENDILEVLGLTSMRYEGNRSPENSGSEAKSLSQTALDFSPPDALETLILSGLMAAPASIDELMTHTQCTISTLSTKLGLMELEGKIQVCSGGRYGRCK